MSDETKMKRAQETFENLCETFDSKGLHYEKDESKLRIECEAQGDDLPVNIIFRIDAEKERVKLLSILPFTTPEDKRFDLAVAVSMVNYRIVNGCFDYDITDGTMCFRMTCAFMDTTVKSDTFLYMLFCAFATVDKYNDKLMMLAKGMISLDKFVETIE